MGMWTNAGLRLIASAVQTSGVNCNITFVSVGTGCGTLSGAVSSGTPLTALPLDAGLPVALSNGQQLTVTDGTNTETVTVNGTPGGGATSIPINSWTPLHNYAAHTTGVCPTQLVTDLALYNEVARVVANAGVSGSTAGESLNSGYFDSTQPTNFYMQVGYWGGSGAAIGLGTGTLMGEDIQVWNHTLNADSSTFQADDFI